MENAKKASATVTVRVSPSDKDFLQGYADSKGLKLASLLREAALEQAEDEYDRQAFDDAMKYNKKRPGTHSMSEIAKEFGVD